MVLTPTAHTSACLRPLPRVPSGMEIAYSGVTYNDRNEQCVTPRVRRAHRHVNVGATLYGVERWKVGRQ